MNQVRVVLSKDDLSKSRKKNELRTLFSPVKSNAVVINFNTGGQSEFVGDTLVKYIGGRYGIVFPLARNRRVRGVYKEYED